MQLPTYLQNAIDRQAHGLPLSDVAAAAEALSASYRGSVLKAINTSLDRIAYLITRFPATYAAAHAALLDVRDRLPGANIESILDLGAGPATAAHAALDVFHGVRQVTLIEQDTGWTDVGKFLAADSPYSALRSASWRNRNLSRISSFDPHDLVLLSYVVGELEGSRLVDVLHKAWDATRRALVIVEPGTPRAFSRLRFLREVLLHDGAHIVGPCPHEFSCPMAFSPSRRPEDQPWASAEENDWCHFGTRVERSSLHRRAKGARLGFEDEKYCYVAVSRSPVALPDARIIRRPIHTSGSVVLSLCTNEGLRAEAVSRGNPSAFRSARRARWGQVWRPDVPAKNGASQGMTQQGTAQQGMTHEDAKTKESGEAKSDARQPLRPAKLRREPGVPGTSHKPQ